jgi:hypothetical protein
VIWAFKLREKGKRMKHYFLFSLFKNDERRCERGEKYINISVARCKPIITPNLKNDFHYQNVLRISAALSCDYLSSYQISPLCKRFKEKFYLLASKFIYHFYPQLTFSKI